MRRYFNLLIIGLFLAAACLLAQGAPSLAADASSKVLAAVSIAPQKYFLEKVGGDLVEAMVMVPPGADAHTFDPSPKETAALSRARVYFAVGVEFEKVWLPKFQSVNPDLLVIHTEANVPRVPMDGGDHEEAEREGEQHGGGHGGGHEAGENHHHGGLDPHIWLSPKLAVIQARAMRNGLAEVDPEHQAAYEKNFQAFRAEAEALDAELAAAFKGLGDNNRLLVYHPAWGYFCRAYGLKEVAVEKEGKEPTARGLAHLIDQAKSEKAKVIFVQPQFSPRAAQTLAKAMGGRVVAIDPLDGNWGENLRRVAREVRGSLY